MKRTSIEVFSLAAICLLMTLAACAPQPTFPARGSPSSEPMADGSPPPRGQEFTSTRFGYSFQYPVGWIIKDKPGEWADFDPLDPNRTNGSDAFAGYVNNRNLALGVGARDLPEEETLESWVQTGVSRGVCYEGIEEGPVAEEQMLLDGEPAVILQYECPSSHDSLGLVVLAMHAQSGYWITWISPQGNADGDQTELRQILSTFSFAE